jgi:ABC-type multidrug transport system fused ATPase/permease subunit
VSGLPALLGGDRVKDAVLIPVLGVGQAAALGVGAFATRDAFAALHLGTGPSFVTLTTLLGAGLAAAGLELVSRQRAEALGQSYARALRRRLYDHIAGMSRRDLSQRRVGALSLRFVGDLSAARAWWGRGVTRLTSAAVVLPGAAVVLYLLDPRLAAWAAPPVALSLGLMLIVARELEARHRTLRSRRAAISMAMMERVAMSPELDLLGRTPKELDGLDEDGASLRANAVARAGQVGALRLMPQAGAALAGAAMLWASGRHGIAPGVTAAGLSVLAILMIPLRELADVWDQFCAWRVAREKVLSLLAQPSRRRVVQPRGRAVEVRVEDLPLGGHALDLVLPAGSLTLLTGPAGSGKSALAALVAGLDRAPEGAVRYDGDAEALPHVLFVGDTATVLQGSLRRALTLGLAPRPKRGQVERAARRFGLGGLLDRLDGIMGRIGEGARDASHSEALRIDLSRASLSKPDLVVIDSARFASDPDRAALIGTLRARTDATVLVAGPPMPDVAFDQVVDLGSITARSSLPRPAPVEGGPT